jgi:hypothetical protein
MKNNNPLNIRKSSTQFIGEIIRENNKPFKDFVCPELGYRAAFRVLNTYITKYKVDTVEKIISRW